MRALREVESLSRMSTHSWLKCSASERPIYCQIINLFLYKLISLNYYAKEHATSCNSGRSSCEERSPNGLKLYNAWWPCRNSYCYLGFVILLLCIETLEKHHFALKMLYLSTSFRVLIGSLTLILPVVSAASLQQVTGFGTNPSNVGMYIYVPDQLVANPPILVDLRALQGGIFELCRGWSKLCDTF